MESRPWLLEGMNNTSETDDNIDGNTTCGLDESINNSLNWIPRIGMQFDTIDDAFKFWSDYGGQIGFGVRRSYRNVSKIDGQVTTVRFVCSKQGCRPQDKRDHLTKNPRAETRTNCLARVGLQFDRETNKFQVHDFVHEHNHLLHTPETCHMIPSQRKISEAQAVQIDLADASGLRPKATHQFFSQQVGGRENLGYTERDQKNYLRSKRQKDLAYGEAGSLLRYLHDQSCENPSFQYAVQLDSEEHITNIFWADTRMIVAYAHFADVVTFDTTYSTNKEYRPFGVFAGFNHHREIVIFGAALLYDETAESFKWLFQTFLEAHKQNKPKTIFTDQDAAMAKALTEVLPDTFHGLCSWHIMQNGIKHLGYLMKDDSYFLTEFSTCMYEYEEEKEFEDAWDAMLCKYNVCGNPWLEKIYELKEKWAKCYMKEVFTIGMRSTQLSESLNSDLKAYLKSNMDIMRFFKQFERVANEKHYKELEAEYNSRQKLPRVKMRNSPILQQVGKVYTPHIFENYFQEEFDWFSAAIVKQRDESSPIHEYTIAIIGEKKEHKEHKVKYHPSDQTVSCSCMKFQNFGILCCHALKVLDVWDIKKIPDQYILKRWTREARNGVVEGINEATVMEDMNLNVTERFRKLCPVLVKIASRASEDEKAFSLALKFATELSKQVEDICFATKSHDDLHNSSEGVGEMMEQRNSIENLLQNVKGLKKKMSCKGRKKRPKAWHENIGKRKKKSSRKDHSVPNSSQEQEDPQSQKRKKKLSSTSISQSSQDQEEPQSKKRKKRSSATDLSIPQSSQNEEPQLPKNKTKKSSVKDHSISQSSQDQEIQPSKKRTKKSSSKDHSILQPSQDQEPQQPSKRKRQLSSRLVGYST